ncbi:glycerate kinase [Methylohalomonas lacus]|uniref:Glycerate kinase n=1 Tax=Methylohalomonas lacus TaxID=398773 RepID=A0AAE3HMD7_9GAMM|nr:glycerate kinase [Methylohalomonas lacus]MCS3903796.1 glycerate kinase [Methylohalomonas lacus]
MKKIVIAPDSFKENLTSLQVAKAIETGVRRVLPDVECIKVPMADGGEGTVQSLVDAVGGKFVRKQVRGPLGNKPVKARYGLLAEGDSAVIEMAEASGLPLVTSNKRDPLRATTYGTGELILDAIDRGARHIIIGIGGSATVDGGAGMAQALGVRFRDKNGRVIREYAAGGMLNRIASIDPDNLDPRVRKAKIIIASDVDNPLVGKRGAAAVFGPQKGATPAMVKTLDANLKHFGEVIKRDLGVRVNNMTGAGAAGGLGAGLVAFTNAKLQSGIDIIVKAVGLADYLQGADLVITGEGQVDFQTAFGKTPAGVAKAAKKARVPVIAIGGGLADDARGVFEHGIHGLDAAVARPMTLDNAFDNAAKYLANAGERALRMIMLGQDMQKKRVRKKAKKKVR